MSEASSIRTKQYEDVKDDPLYVAWATSDKIYRSVVKRYCAEYQRRLEEEKSKIQTEVGKLFADEMRIAHTSLMESFEAYADFYKEQPPQPTQEKK